MSAILGSHRLSELVAARLTGVTGEPGAHDEVAGIVLGPRLRDLCVALGVPVTDWMRVLRWADRGHDRDEVESLGAYVDVLVADRCGRPSDDLVSDLVAFDVDGCGLTADDIRTIVVDLVRHRRTQPV